MLIKGRDLNNNYLYRITNEEENHNGFQYKTGLNTDHIEFSPNRSMFCRRFIFF